MYYKNSYTEDRIFFDYFHAKEVRQKTTLYDESVFPGLNASYVHNEPYVDWLKMYLVRNIINFIKVEIKNKLQMYIAPKKQILYKILIFFFQRVNNCKP